MSCLGGSLLVASPYLADRNFFRSVVLIISHDDEHAFGLLLNRPGYESLTEHWESRSGNRHVRREMIRTGGPLDGPLMVLHQAGEFSDTQIVPDVHLATIQETIECVISSSVKPILPAVGFSGWGAGQLEIELEVGGWMTLPASSEIVFADAAEMWNIAARRVSDHILTGVDLRHVPQDPTWN